MDTVFSPYLCSKQEKEEIRAYALSQGFSACGFAAVHPVDADVADAFRNWLKAGKHSSMAYMENHLLLRDNPASLSDGAKTVISVALNYFPSVKQKEDAPQFSYYAYGKDYHDVMRAKLGAIATFLSEKYGSICRCCVDSAPVRERYWAQQAGIGFVGRNNQLILPGKGSYFFLGEIIASLAIPPDNPCRANCGTCRRCVDACPTQALPCDYGAVDARRCISCLTVEHRGDFPPNVAEKFGKRVYGCDECQRVCPHNRFATPTSVPEFAPSEEFLSLSFDNMGRMTEDDFRRIFKGSAVKRAKYAGLMRNFAAINRRGKENEE